MEVNEYQYKTYLCDYKTSTDLQHRINAWSKLGFIAVDVQIPDNGNPTFKIKGEVDNATVRKAINQLKDQIDKAKETNNFEEVVPLQDFALFIKGYDEANGTTLYTKYLPQLEQLERYITDPAALNSPPKREEAETVEEPKPEKQPKQKTEKKDTLILPKDNELIAVGPKGVTNQGMIPAITKYVNNNDIDKLNQLKSLYPAIFESSKKYLGKRLKDFLDKHSI